MLRGLQTACKGSLPHGVPPPRTARGLVRDDAGRSSRPMSPEPTSFSSTTGCGPHRSVSSSVDRPRPRLARGGSSSHPCQPIVDGPEVEPLRLEVRPHPRSQLLELFVRGIEQDLEQPLVAADAAAVFGRAGARAVETPGASLVARLAHLLNFHDVPPRVAEVVLVHEPPAALLDDVEEGSLDRFDALDGEPGKGGAHGS